MLRSMISSNPMLSQMARQNPEIEFILSNPEMMRAMMTPENMRMAMGMMQGMRGMPGANPFMGMPGMPGATFPPATGTSAPEGTTGTASGPAPATGTATAPPPMGIIDFTILTIAPFGGFDLNAFAQMMGGMQRPPAAPATSTAAPSATGTGTSTVPPTTTSAAPGPWQAPPAYPAYPNYFDMLRMFRPPGAPTAAPAAPAAPPMDPKVQYAVQLDKMKEMGFVNEEVNLEALKATNGNVEAAIERILSMLK